MSSSNIEEKRDHLLGILRGYGSVVVAFSAGVDSSVVAKAAFLACGSKAVAVTGVSPSLAFGELDQARQVAALIGIRHEIVETDEFRSPDYLANPGNRCYFCKTELYGHLRPLADKLGLDFVVNGANIDDLGDYRPGMLAATESAVKSPLVEARFAKDDVRQLARVWALPVSEKPASPCLSSRIAYGVEVTAERVRRIDAAERFVSQLTGAVELRVRLEARELARIEVPIDYLQKLTEPEISKRLVEKLLDLGFSNVTIDLQGLRSGNLNSALGGTEKLVLISNLPKRRA